MIGILIASCSVLRYETIQGKVFDHSKHSHICKLLQKLLENICVEDLHRMP